MLKHVLLGAFLLTASLAHAQITPEARYNARVYASKLSTGDVKYGGYFPAANAFRIYNANHSLYRQVALPAGLTFGSYDDNPLLSDRLFNTNTTDLEFVIVGTTTTGTQQTFILSESGTTVFTVDSCSSVTVFNTPTGAKLRASGYKAAVGTNLATPTTRIFALPGTYTTLLAVKATPAEQDVAASPYPNPSSGTVRLPYLLKAGQTATLRVSDVTGRTVATYKVDNTFNHLLFDTHALSAGVYFYRVGNSGAQRFAVK